MVAVLQPVNPGKVIAIDRAVILVGRGSDCDAIIGNSQKISRRHCCLVQVDETYYVRDLGSMNGVWLNGSRVNRETMMNSGDRVAIGDVEFLFHPNARIEQKKTVTPAAMGENLAEVADVVAEPAGTNDDVALINSGQILLVDVAGEDDVVEVVKVIDDVVEVIDDVIPLEDDDLYLDVDELQTNEVEIIDEPILDDRIFGSEESPEDDDNLDEVIVFEDD